MSIISKCLTNLLDCPEDSYSVPNAQYRACVDAVIASIKANTCSIPMEALKRVGEHIKGDFNDDGCEIWEIGDPINVGQGVKPFWISVGIPTSLERNVSLRFISFPCPVMHFGLNEKDEDGDWITFS